MDTSNWINLIAGILVGGGTLTLAVMTWKSIQQTRDIHKKERRDRLLNEIIEWAIDVTECGKRPDLSDLLHLADDKQKSFLPIRLREAVLSIGLMKGRNEYISTISLIFGQEFQENVDILIDCLETYKELLGEKSKDINITPESIEEIEAHDQQLLTLAIKVIEEATKIKTIDIGKKEEDMSKEDKTTGNNEPTLKVLKNTLDDKTGKWKKVIGLLSLPLAQR